MSDDVFWKSARGVSARSSWGPYTKTDVIVKKIHIKHVGNADLLVDRKGDDISGRRASSVHLASGHPPKPMTDGSSRPT